MAFREADAGVVGHERAVVELRRRGPQSAVEEELTGGADEQVRAANDFSDTHIDVVHYAGQLIGGDIVIAPDHKIAEVLAGNELLRAEMGVGERDGFAIGNTEAPAEFTICDLRFAQFPAGSRVDWFLIIFGMRSACGGLEVFARADAGIDEAGLIQLLQRIAIERAAFALIVGREGAADIGAFLPIEAKPAEVFEHGNEEFWFAAGAVEVFVAKNESAGVGAGTLLGDPEGSCVAEMQVAGRRRGDSAAVGLTLQRIHWQWINSKETEEPRSIAFLYSEIMKINVLFWRAADINKRRLGVGNGEILYKSAKKFETNMDLRRPKGMRRAFSLVELLVVIAIISILAALLLPALSRAKNQASKVTDLNNLKQIMVSTHMYATDEKDHMPLPNWDNGGPLADGNYYAGWLYLADPNASPPERFDVTNGVLWSSLRELKIYLCPMDDPTASTFGQRPQQISSYAMNGAVTGYMHGQNNPTEPSVKLSAFLPTDCAYWETDERHPEYFNDGANYPAEGVSARHLQGGIQAAFDSSVSYVRFDDWYAEVAQTNKNRLWCYPYSADGGDPDAPGHTMIQ